MKERQRIGLTIVLVVMCTIQLWSMPEVPGVAVARCVFIFLASIGVVMLVVDEA